MNLIGELAVSRRHARKAEREHLIERWVRKHVSHFLSFGVWLLRKFRPIFAFECLVANEVRARRPVKAVSRRRRGPKVRLYRTSRTDHHQPPGVDGSPPRWFFSAIFLRFHAAALIFHW